MNKDFSRSYRVATALAINEAIALKFPNGSKISPYQNISNKKLLDVREIVMKGILPILAQNFNYDYWGTSCINLSAHIFGALNALGIKADIVFGEVEINGTDEYDTSLDNLIHEYTNEVRTGIQNIHAWVTIGDDVIIDASLPDRIIKHYHLPIEHVPEVFVLRAFELNHCFNSKHKPMLVGSDFIAKTNNFDPLDIVEHIKLSLGQTS